MTSVVKKTGSARKAAEAAAQKALQDRVALVGAIGEAQAAVEALGDEKETLIKRHEAESAALDQKVVDAEQLVRDAYDKAVSEGWTARDLASMGIEAPRKRRKRRRANAAPHEDPATISTQPHGHLD